MKKCLQTLVISFLLIFFLPMAKLSAQVSTWDGTWEPWTQGTGTETDPFLIENAQQLAYLTYRVNNGLDAGGTHVSNHDYHYKLMIDIDLNGSDDFQWTPIGYCNSDTDYQCFGGSFDGNGHTISGLFINSTANRIGFFGHTDGAIVENLEINAQVLATTGNYAGSIIGCANGTTIINGCINSGCVSLLGNGWKYSGGIVGFVGNGSVISNCNNKGNVSSSISVGGQINIYSGGIVGNTSNCTIINCHNTGNVSSSCTGNAHATGCYAGGIVGCFNGSIINCFNTGSIYSSHIYNAGYSYLYSGGVLGVSLSGTIVTTCYNTGDVTTGDIGSGRWTGGIVGHGTSTTISNCYNTGNLANASNGGIVGNVGNTTNNSYYLSTCGGSNTYGGQPLSAEAMHSEEFVDMINNGTCAWEYDANNTNSGYPVLTCILVSTSSGNATDVTQSHATLHGTIEVENTSIQSQGFEYKKATDSVYQIAIATGNGDISKTITHLTPNTQYQFRTFCTTVSCGTFYGDEKTFTTSQITVTTNNASEITQSHVTLNGNLTTGDASILSQGFQYKKASDLDYQTVTITGSGDVFTTLSDLVPNTQYRFRLFCTPQGYETVYGQEKTFNTLAINVTTMDATGVTQTHATLNGNLNVGDAIISSQGFEYKKTSDSDYQIVNVTGIGDISTVFSDLTPNTQYRFRTFCTPQGCETVYGQENIFNTLAINITTYNSTDVTQTHAILNGKLQVGDAIVSAQGFEFKQSSEPTYQTISVTGTGNISDTLSGLKPNTTYYYRTFCTLTGYETTYGVEKSFTTLPVGVTTHPATEVTASSAILNGSINFGDATLTSKGFEYRISGESNYTTINVTDNNNDFTKQLTGLQVNTIYEYRVFMNIVEDTTTYFGTTKTFEVTWLNQDTICINNVETLRWVSEQCNSGTTFEGKYLQLMNDITLPLNVPNNMTSIGSYPDHPFKGTFDGNGKLIHNLYIDRPNTPYQGFFGYALDANLYNVGLINITASGRNYTGGMVAYAENTHMRDCYVNGGTLFALSYCGGLVGYQEQGTNSIISGCYNTCTVSGNHYVGGLVGFSNYGTVRNSYVAAPVTGQGHAIGAIIGGANEVLMYYCYFSTDITGLTVAIGENNFKGGEGLTNAQMRDPQFVATLNQGLVIPVWMSDYTSNINNGFPIIKWQRPGTSVEENNAAKNYITIYPNPANNFITIQSDDPNVSLKQVVVYDITGRQVMTKTMKGQSQGFSIAKLPAGIYQVRVQTDNGRYNNLKLVVK